MNDRHDRVPDPAALDELSRAFDDPPDQPDEPEELLIVEQVPHEPPGPVEPAPTIVRIDDYSGVVAVRPADEPADAVTGDPVSDDLVSDDLLADDPVAGDPVADDAVSDDAVSDDPVSGGAPSDELESADANSADAADGQPDEVVVISVEDDLPDAVYVEGSLERNSGRSIVFIEDDETGDALAPDADAQRGIEPRMRERRVAVKRAQSRKRLKWVVLGAAVVLVAVSALALLGSPLFAVRADQVTVTSNVYTDPERLEEIVDDLVGTPALRVDSQRLERELEEISWVDTARVTVDFPHAATIDIREREAMTTYQGLDGRFRVLDREGRVLDVIDNYPFAYVLLRGPDPVDLEQGEFAPAGYAAASELVKNFTASIRGRVDYIDVTADGSRLVLFLDDGSTVFFGEARDFFAKLLRLESVLAANPDRAPGPIDVSTDDVTL